MKRYSTHQIRNIYELYLVRNFCMYADNTFTMDNYPKRSKISGWEMLIDHNCSKKK
jgi:hypothetical protein